MRSTVSYYDKNAEEYYRSTVDVDLDQARLRFAAYLPEHAQIIDVGCGSGRDVKAFCEMGFQAVGLDVSEKLAQIASRELGVRIIVGDMATWVAAEPFDGIWCCASLLHLTDEQVRQFADNLRMNLKPGGAIYISVKSGITTGFDEKGRYMQNFTEEELAELLQRAEIEIVEEWDSPDKMDREGLWWINVVGVRNR